MALGKKVKTAILTSLQTVAAGDEEWTNAIALEVFQDDVRIIGFQIGMQPTVLDAAVNADHEFQGMSELSRSGIAQQDGVLARATWGLTYTAAIVAQTGLETSHAPAFFPDGMGVDLDDGETVYLHVFGKNTGTVGITIRPWAIVYYVER